MKANQKTSRRFNSPQAAANFAKKVNATVTDLRSNDNRISDYKVNYIKGSHVDSFDNGETNFNSSLNGGGTRWHTAEDL